MSEVDPDIAGEDHRQRHESRDADRAAARSAARPCRRCARCRDQAPRSSASRSSARRTRAAARDAGHRRYRRVGVLRGVRPVDAAAAVRAGAASCASPSMTRRPSPRKCACLRRARRPTHSSRACRIATRCRVCSPRSCSRRRRPACRSRAARTSGARTRAGPVARYQLALPVTGSYPAVRKFVDSTLAAVPAAALSGITLERPNVGDGQVSANLRFEVFVRTTP